MPDVCAGKSKSQLDILSDRISKIAESTRTLQIRTRDAVDNIVGQEKECKEKSQQPSRSEDCINARLENGIDEINANIDSISESISRLQS